MSTSKRLVAAVFVVVGMVIAALAFGGGAASAYPGGTNPSIALDKNSGAVGDNVVVTGAHFTPGHKASLSFHSTPVALGTVTVSGAGTFSVTITVPNVSLGAHTIVAVDNASGIAASAAFTVSGSGAGGAGGGGGGGGGSLAGTGVAVLGIASLGLVLLVGGGLMLLAGRRRKVSA